MLSGKWWALKVALLLSAASYLVQAPALEIKRNFFPVIERQGNNLLTPLPVANEAIHEAKLAFRLVPPMLVHFLRLSAGEYYVVQVMLGVATLAGIAWLLHRAGYSRGWAAAITGGIVCTYMGSVWFIDTQPYFDAIAASALVLALCVMDPIVVFVGASIAMWTDERSLLALGVVALFHLYRRHRDGAIAAGAAVVAYVLVRLYLGAHYGLTTGKADIGPSVFVDFWTGMPLPMLLALEGLWAVVIVAYWRAFQARRWLVFAAGALTAASAGVSMMVNDVTRSTVYMLPGVLFAFVVLVDMPRRDALLKCALGACVVVPTSAAIVTTGSLAGHVSLFYPLLFRLVF